ncbi:MAG: hypothetical protein K8I27_17335 [Planctomycetes bacterium]|nr:hypothetical protein [Planctomycetota bacterium]
MEYFVIGLYAAAFGLNVLFAWLGARWVARKGYPELYWLMFVIGVFAGFVMTLLVISVMPGKARRVPRRSLHRKLPAPRLPQGRVRES